MINFMRQRIQIFPMLAWSILVLMLGVTVSSYAQSSEEAPVRDYNNPEAMISLDRETSFQQALQVINNFSTRFADKFVVDRTGTEGRIGISLPNMHWEEALRTLVDIKQKQLVEQPKYFEIIEPREPSGQDMQAQSQNRQAVSGGQTGGQGGSGEGIPPGLDTQTQEVRIKATFFEGSRRALQEIGVDWSTLTSEVPENVQNYLGGEQSGSGGSGGSSGGSGSSGQGGFPETQFDETFVVVDQKGAQSVSQNVFSSLINLGEIGETGIEVQALFSAFEADNLGEILSTPSVKVMDGEQGRIQVGQDFSIKQRDFAGNVIDKFYSVGTILEVTPHIIRAEDTTFIYMDIMAERSSAQPDPVSTIINKQTASSQILLLNGEATVIAGLYRTEKSVVRKGIPILKDLPPWFLGLRYLFGYNSTDQQVRELVILIEAQLEQPVASRIADRRDDMPTILEKTRKEMRRYPKPSNFNIDEPDRFEETVFSSEDVNSSKTYYIVGGSFKNREKAKQFSRRLKDQGFDPEVLKKRGSDFFLVSYFKENNISKAEMLLNQIQKNRNSSAWIYSMTEQGKDPAIPDDKDEGEKAEAEPDNETDD